MSAQFDALEREIINTTLRRALRVIDSGDLLAHAGLHLLDDKVASQLRNVRDELKQLRDAQRPAPASTRTRVVTDPHAPDFDHRWKCEGGQIFWSASWTTGLRWEPLAAMKAIDDTTCGFPTPERIAMWADLLAAPTETVE